MFVNFLFKWIDQLFKFSSLLIINIYRTLISPLIGSNCRFNPTCSQYALEAYGRYTFLKATGLVFKRILKCHPYSSGGHDPLQKSNG